MLGCACGKEWPVKDPCYLDDNDVLHKRNVCERVRTCEDNAKIIRELHGMLDGITATVAAPVAETPDTKSYLGVASDAASRKAAPIMEGCIDYFPAALAAVAAVSKAGNDQHNPGQPLHWSRGKSGDHANCAVRHLADRGRIDSDGHRHSAKAAWRALANLQEELEAAGLAPMPRAAWVDKK